MSVLRDGIVLISGYAKLPANITSEEIFHTAVVVVLVDLQVGTIVKAECSTVTNVAKEFIANLMVGYNLSDGIDMLIQRINQTYYGQAKKAIITSIKMIYAKYQEITEKGE
ncbi:MAG: DUF3870 domain-containing protein [Oscillospiraceae bacterium]|jgi:hypothetical protein